VQSATASWEQQLALLVRVVLLLQQRSTSQSDSARLLALARQNITRQDAPETVSTVAASTGKKPAAGKAPAAPAKADKGQTQQQAPAQAQAVNTGEQQAGGVAWPTLDLAFWTKVEQLLDHESGLSITSDQPFVTCVRSILSQQR
jgi:hypothetical protein